MAKKEAAGDFSHLKNKKGELVGAPLPQPTLPNIKLDDEDMDDTSIRTRGNDYYYGSDQKSTYAASEYPPPMPAYSKQYGGYAPSVTSTIDDPSAYYAEYDSKTNLAAAAAPMGRQGNDLTVDRLTNPHSATYNQDAFNAGYGYDAHGGHGHDAAAAYAYSDPNEYTTHGQAYGGYGQEYDQGYGQAYDNQGQGAIAYEPQAGYGNTQGHYTNPPARTASRAQQHQYDDSAYQQQQQQQQRSYGGHGGGYAVG